jgi:hypothetical protein
MRLLRGPEEKPPVEPFAPDRRDIGRSRVTDGRPPPPTDVKSIEHTAVGAVAAAVAVRAVAGERSRATQLGLWTYGLGLSVLIDVDHFPIARMAVGDWRHLRRVLADPALLLFGQDEIFDLDFRRTRIASHLLVGAGLTATLRRRAPAAAVVTAVCLAAHVVADALRDGDVV